MLLLFLIISVCSCSGETATSETTTEERVMQIYYVNKNATKVVSDSYKPKNSGGEELLKELLEVL